MRRLAILASHPIQYQAPLFRALAARPEIETHVFFCSDEGYRSYRDEQFGLEFQWDIDLTEGYQHQFLDNWGRPSFPVFLRRFNPSVIVRLLEFDVVWLHGWNHISSWLAIIALGLAGIPCLLRGETNGLRELPIPQRWVKRLILRAFFLPVKGFLCIGSLNRQFYERLGVPSGRLFNTPYAIENERFAATRDKRQTAREEICSRYGIDGSQPIILFAGKFIPKKRPLDLLRAFSRITDGGTLLLVGEGTLRGEMERYITDRSMTNVRFAGFQNQSSIPSFYRAADVIVVPSDDEPWGLVVNEAMASGLAVVASDAVGAAVDLIRNGENGYVFPARDVDQLTNRLEAVIRDRRVCQDMGLRSQVIVRDWSIDECVNEVVRVVLKVCK